jgi:hypothetical protein
LLIVARAQSRPNGWSHFASVSIRAMTARAIAVKQLLAGVGDLREQ